jgi:uncharacterized protein
MNFAINYSLPAASLLAEGKIELDCFKCPNWPHLVFEARPGRPFAVHFNLEAGRPGQPSPDLDAVQDLLDATGTRYVNLHLSSKKTDFPGYPADSCASGLSQTILDTMRRDLARIVDRFGAHRVIAENAPYQGAAGRAMRPASEPENIRRIIEEAGCGLLLDISHARISAHYLGMDAHEYMDALPVASLREMHFTGLLEVNGLVEDHYPARPEDWSELEWVLEKIRSQAWSQPDMLAFEYGGIGGHFEARTDPTVIANQVPRLYAMARTV